MNQKTKLPFFDLTRQFAPLKKEVMAKFETLLDNQTLIGGDTVVQFEKQISDWMGGPHTISVSNGTDALVVALRALGVGPGDEVITPAFSFFASTGSILLVGAKPVFADIDPLTYNIDPQSVAQKVTNKTKVIMPVHLYGQCADMDPIMDIAKSHNLSVLEDFAQSIGARYKDKQAGTIGTIGATSFYPTKNLGSSGEGGMVTTMSAELAEKVKIIRVHGGPRRYVHEILGTNARMDAMKAAYLSIKLPHLHSWMNKRNKIAQTYLTELKPLEQKGLVLPQIAKDCTHVWNQFVVRVQNRLKVQQKLLDEGVPSEIYYPMTIPMQKALRGISEERGWPVSEKATEEVLALPIFPELNGAEQELVISALKKALQ